MADRKLHLEDSTLTRIPSRVIEAGVLHQRPWVRLEETIFHDGSGGQPADRGAIDGVAVVEVLARGGKVIHVLEAPLGLGPVTCEIDAARRLDHAQQHTAQHLVTALLQDRHGLPTTAFHLGADATAIEVAGPAPSDTRLRELEEEVNVAVRSGAAVRFRLVGRDALDRLAVRTRGLPDGHVGPVRLVEIEGFDLNTCGGTHVTSLAGVQAIHLLDASPARGGARIRFLAGGRVLGALRRHEAIEEGLKERIGTAAEEFAGVIDLWRRDAKALERRVRGLRDALAAARAQALAASPGRRIVAVVSEAGPDELRALASEVLARRPEAVVVLVGSVGDPPEACFLVQAGPDGPEDVAREGESVRARLGARGGGRGRFYQGRGGRSPVDAGVLESP